MLFNKGERCLLAVIERNLNDQAINKLERHNPTCLDSIYATNQSSKGDSGPQEHRDSKSGLQY